MFKHRYFSLEPLKREVHDEHGKLSQITGNPYRLLELLCDRYPASLTITDINLAFDPAGAREYTEAHVRRMKNLIHKALRREVIRYRNKVYSLIGELGKAEENAAKEQARPLRFVSVLKMENFLRLRVKTSDGRDILYTNENFEGKI